MYALHIGNKNYSSWSLRPWILLHELHIPFSEVLENFVENGSRAAFRTFSPSGTVPCLVDDGLTVWDSLSIIEYLAENSGKRVWPESASARAWSRSVAAELHSGFFNLRGSCSMSVGHRVRLHETSAALLGELQRVEEIVAQGLARSGGPFLCGEAFSAVDAFLAPFAFRWQSYRLPCGPKTVEYFSRLLALDGMREWTRAALADPWREPAHEREIAASGVVLEDLRSAAVSS